MLRELHGHAEACEIWGPQNTVPKTKTLLFHLTPYGKIRPRRTRQTTCHLIWIIFRDQHLAKQEPLGELVAEAKETLLLVFLVFSKKLSFSY